MYVLAKPSWEVGLFSVREGRLIFVLVSYLTVAVLTGSSLVLALARSVASSHDLRLSWPYGGANMRTKRGACG